MHITISLPENPTDDQVQKAIEMIGHYAGNTVMSRVASKFMGTTVAPPPPPSLIPPAIIPPNVSGQSGVDALQASTYTGPNNVTVELDKDGLPWDERIHSGSKNRNKDGSWKAKKNVSEVLVGQVTIELRNAIGNRTYLPGGTAPPATPPAVHDTNMPLMPPTVHTQVPPAVAPLHAAGGDAITTFPQLMQKVAPMMASKKITQQQLQECAVAMGVANFGALGARPDLIPGADAYLMMVATP